MLDAIKVLFILTGASTYLVTKYINVGMDSEKSNNNNNTDGINHQFTQSGKFSDEISDQKMKALWTHNKSMNETLADDEQMQTINKLLTDAKISNHEYSSKLIQEKYISARNHTFEQPVYEIQITEEETDLPKRLLQVRALTISNTDVKQYYNHQQHVNDDKEDGIMFILTGDGVDDENPSLSKFAINAFSGELYLISPIDRDPPNGLPQWKLNITAEDDKGNKLEGSASIIVNVRDINDNVPYFLLRNYYGNISENSVSGERILSLSAEDVDENNAIKYSIEMNRVNSDGELIFRIEESSGTLLSAVCCLDRESIDHYMIKVCASDGGSSKSCVTVIIQILDENDEIVKFAKKEVSLTITDHDIYVNRQMVNISVIDNDLLQTNKFVYKILNHSHYAKYFSVTTNADGTGNLKIIEKFSLDPMDTNDYNDNNNKNSYYDFTLTIAVSDIGQFSDDSRVDYSRVTIRVNRLAVNSNTWRLDPKSTDSFVSISGHKSGDELFNATSGFGNKSLHKVSYNNSADKQQKSNIHFSFEFPFALLQEMTVFYLILIAIIIIIIALIILLLFIKIRHYYSLSSKLSTNLSSANTSGNRSNNEMESSSDIDLRDAIRNYNYEGGGECDISFYDLTQLQIPIQMIANSSLTTTATINSDLKCESMQKLLLLPDVCTKSKISNTTSLVDCKDDSETINIFVVE